MRFPCFSALQRAEIAEMPRVVLVEIERRGFSALQRAEIAEMGEVARCASMYRSFSALQRAEIAEIATRNVHTLVCINRFSALQRAEIAEMDLLPETLQQSVMFQCSSTSRNC